MQPVMQQCIADQLMSCCCCEVLGVFAIHIGGLEATFNLKQEAFTCTQQVKTVKPSLKQE